MKTSLMSNGNTHSHRVARCLLSDFDSVHVGCPTPWIVSNNPHGVSLLQKHPGLCRVETKEIAACISKGTGAILRIDPTETQGVSRRVSILREGIEIYSLYLFLCRIRQLTRRQIIVELYRDIPQAMGSVLSHLPVTGSYQRARK